MRNKSNKHHQQRQTKFFLFEQYNSPFSDFHLVVKPMQESYYLLCDLGDMSWVPIRVLQKVRTVCISHTHMDHFVGFHTFLRHILDTRATIRFFAPPQFMMQLGHAIQSFVWNLLNREHPLFFEIYEIHPEGYYHIPPTHFMDIFQRAQQMRKEHLLPLPLYFETSHDNLQLYPRILDHKIPVLGFFFKRKDYISVQESILQKYPILKGKWISEYSLFLENQLGESPASMPISSTDFSQELQDILKAYPQIKEAFQQSHGESFAYLTDFIYSEANLAQLMSIPFSIQHLFIESHFMAEEKHLAQNTYHLTRDESFEIARLLHSSSLYLGHFSARYAGKNLSALEEYWNISLPPEIEKEN